MTIFFVSSMEMHGALREAPSADWHGTRADAQVHAQRHANKTGETHFVYSVEKFDYFEPEVPVEPDLDLTGYKLWNPPLHSKSMPRGIGLEDYVSVILRDGNVLSPELASHYNWDVNYEAQALGTFDESDIIAYRVVEDWERAKDGYVPFFGDLKGTLPKGVGPRTLVLVKFRNMEPTQYPCVASALTWSIEPENPDGGDIVSYMIAEYI